MTHSALGLFRLVVAGAVGLASLSGCEEQASDEPRGGGYVESPAPTPADQPVAEPAAPRARSAYGKAKEYAEKVINEDVAEYQRKLMEEADRKP